MDIFRLNLCTPLRHPVRSKTKTKGVLYAQAQPEKVRILVSLRDEKKFKSRPRKTSGSLCLRDSSNFLTNSPVLCFFLNTRYGSSPGS